MSTTILGDKSLIINEGLKSRSSDVLKEIGDEAVESFTISTNTGKTLKLDAEIADLITQVLGRIALGGQLTIKATPEILTTSTAANILGISRPTLMKLIRNKEIPANKVGTHHRLRFEDVMCFKDKQESKRQKAVAELVNLDY